MTYKQIEASREIRLWITQVIAPVLLLTTAVAMSDPETKAAVVAKVNGVKAKIKNALHK